ncbi:saccharopine dehydrogenase [Actinomadura sp. CNU-125]|uniref:saccharopine dehydrogenase NADP-binding domain-containing protein n=1 Tax=Actinomadura sp. CNU-125 TaxID=1904961 RepID=UPI00096994CD|nr:saccharopine dehydrogenase NADP-binding domain-containing protein [Actinomadura sp. CNU-125]OLT27897.1 saccharopine dehydrogenase [Actinomadura sp. CNU-125]
MKIAVYGANGYQGKLVLAEANRRGLGVVLVGRDAARLRRAADAVGLSGPDVRVAAVDDRDALVAAFRTADAVVNCAGPFTRTGAAVVEAAIAAGRHYLDTAGEQLYIKSVFDGFGARAAAAGVCVVPAANDACVPGDMVAALLAERLGPLEEITSVHLISGGGGPSRGSLRSVIESIDIIKAGGLVYDGGDWRPAPSTRQSSIVLPGGGEAVPMAPFPLSEVVTIPRHVRVGRVRGLAEAELTARLSAPLDPAVIEGLPEGPTERARATQRFTYLIDAVAPDGRRARGIVEGPDTYGTTAVIAVEGARRLITDPAEPGVLAPAQAYPPADFLDSLLPGDVRWSVQASGL